jgi:predicted RNase H-like nuclease
VVAYLAAGAARPEVEVVAHFDAVAGYLERGEVGHVAVDMPIGLPDVGPRPCDVAARRLLGPRRSSVFPAPVRATLGSASFADALARSRSASGRGLPIQAYNLLGRIAEVEEAVRRVGQSRLTETHPELAFAALAGAPIAQSKRHPAGAAARRAALTAVWPTVGEVLLGRRAGCRGDDVADACALAWSADRLRRGRATILGGDPDRTGLRMEIAW